jgi:hypothetical protein
MKAALFFMAFLTCTSAWAQTSGTVDGRVWTETGGILAALTVELRGNGDALETVTDGEGRYVFERGRDVSAVDTAHQLCRRQPP